MKKVTKTLLAFVIAALCVPFMANAQFADSGPLQVGVFGGVSTYNGDLQEQNMTYLQSHPSFGLFIRKEIHEGFGLEFGVNFGKLSGADSLATSTARKLRNLDFQSTILDVHLLIQYHILHSFRLNTPIDPYVFAGLAVFHFDPYTYYSQPGNPVAQKVYLRPFHTEGQGLFGYPDRQVYDLTQFSIPFGIGVKYPISDDFNIGLVISMRHTFTDYIDDVSRTYVDFNTQHSLNAFSTKMAFRTDELPGHENDPFPPDGFRRGNPDKNDFYFFTGLKISYNIPFRSAASKQALRQIACPTY